MDGINPVDLVGIVIININVSQAVITLEQLAAVNTLNWIYLS